MATLETRALRKRFGSVSVTDDVSLALERGARHALIGPNGAGKTTLMGLLSGTLRPDSGAVLIDDVDVTHESAVRRVGRGLGRTFQITNLFRNLMVRENLFLALSERDGLSASMFRSTASHRKVIAEADDILHTLGLADARDRKVSEIAYGDQRLVEIALALCMRPKILLLDEPAAGIPAAEMSRVIAALQNLPAETTILLIEHDMNLVRQFADRLSVLVEGRLIETGRPSEVLASERVKSVYLGHGRRHVRHGAARAGG